MQGEIRKGTKSDIEGAFRLVVELAIFENAEHEIANTCEKMTEDGFGRNPLFEFYVVEEGGEIVGLSLFYYRYSTWKGKRLYLEDIIVSEAYRGKGYGKLLLDATVGHAKRANCTGMMWQVLDWNEPAINFYKKYGALIDGSWHNCHLDF